MSDVRSALERALPDRNAWIAIAYLAAVFGFGRLDLPQVGFVFVALAAAGVGAWALLRHQTSPVILWFGIAVIVAMGLPPLLGILRGQDAGSGQLAFALALGVAVWVTALIPASNPAMASS